jgi:opacity protein-like surface antigen
MRKLVFLLLSCVATPALAADLPGKAPARPAPAAVADWTGFYVGIHGGYGWGDNPFNEGVIELDAPDFAIHGIESKGYVFGGHFGHNWQRGAWVGGIEADISTTGIKGSESRSASLEDGEATVTFTRDRHDKFNLLGSARGRIGFLLTPNLLFYGHWRARLDAIHSRRICHSSRCGGQPIHHPS